jgi:isopenicillin N synthase-like dioxygenase
MTDRQRRYHNSLQSLSHRLVHLIEEAFGIPVGTFDAFFQDGAAQNPEKGHISPQHRIKLVKYPPSPQSDGVQGQGVGAHKDSSGWLTLLLQVGEEKGLEVLGPNGEWIAAPPISGTFVVNFGNALEAATEGAVRATIHCVKVCR